MGLRICIGLAVSLLSTAAVASPAPATRLVSCESDSCLLVTGHRANSATPVSINGHVVAVEGGRSWKVRLPLATVRAWAEPYARSIDVTDGTAETTAEASLPIGLLGHVTNLASLVVRAH
jgi:hypothetical protein